jgi:hypothetical protein
MKRYLINFGHGIVREVIAANPFKAMSLALDMLSISDQMVLHATEFRITCKPRPA